MDPRNNSKNNPNIVIMDDLDDILMEDIEDIIEIKKPLKEEQPAEQAKNQPVAMFVEKAEEQPAAMPEEQVENPSPDQSEIQPEATSADQSAIQPEKSVDQAADQSADSSECPSENQPAAEFGKLPEDFGTGQPVESAENGQESGKENRQKSGKRKNGSDADQKEQAPEEQLLKGMVDPQPEPEKKKTSPWKVIGIIFLVLLILALIAAGCAYGYGVKYYEAHFLPGTEAEGVRLDNLTLEEADAKMTAEKVVEDLQMQLVTMDGDTVTLDTTPMNIRRHYLGLPEALAAQDKWRFFLTVDEPKPLPPLEYEIVYDEAGALEALQKLDICDPEKTEAPMDSYVYQDEKTKEWKVMEATDGNTLDPEIVAAAVTKAVDERNTQVDITSTGAYLKAQVREDDEALNRRAAQENAVDSQQFAIDLGAETIREITSEEFRSLLKDGIFEPGLSQEEMAAGVLDEEKYNRFMDSISRSYSTKSASGYRYFKSVTGAKIAMKTDYGWDMDVEATSSLVRSMLEDAGAKIFVDENLKERYPDHQVTAVWKQTAISHGERDTGESWVEVNLTQQKAYCIIDGETVLESDVVSGTETSKGRRTPAGFFAIKFKSTERDLVGYNSDGTESYRSHVHYWMPVYNNIGLHDATWRNAFGGKHYLYSGSHGCVNMPLKAAKELYGYVYKDMPVIFYRENLNGKKQ